MGVTEADFNALVEDLIDAMETEDVPLAAQNDLLSRLAPMQGDIVADGDVLPPPELRESEPRDSATPAAREDGP